MSFYITDLVGWITKCSRKRRLRRFRPTYGVQDLNLNDYGISNLNEVTDEEVIRAIKTVPYHFSTSYRQTDTASVDTGPYNGNPYATGVSGLKMIAGGTAGSTTYTAGLAFGATGTLAMWETDTGVPGLTSWASGTITVKLNVTAAADGDTFINNTSAFRVDSSGTFQSTVGTQSILAIATVGVLTASITAATQAATGVGDRLVVEIVGTENSGSGFSSMSYKSDQLITAPWSSTIAPPTRWLVGPNTSGPNIWEVAPGLVP